MKYLDLDGLQKNKNYAVDLGITCARMLQKRRLVTDNRKNKNKML